MWGDAYPEHHAGCEYVFQGAKDGQAVKALLQTSKLTPGELMETAKAAWGKPTGFQCKMAASICGFNSKFNEIRHELKNGTHKQPATGRNVGHNATVDYSQRPKRVPSEGPNPQGGAE